MPSTAPHRTAAPPPAPGVTRLGDADVNFYLVDDPGGLVLVDGGMPGTSRSSGRTWKAPAASSATSARSC
jgi:hypothetical protein